jgi:hypothetical protein
MFRGIPVVGNEQVKELMDKAEQDEVDAAMEEDDPEDEEF